MLVAPADIRRNDFQNDAVLARPAIRANQFWKVDTLDLDLSGPQICYSAIACHGLFSLFWFDVFLTSDPYSHLTTCYFFLGDDLVPPATFYLR
jgi:hypothetical protein